jgi:hypothetical protein
MDLKIITLIGLLFLALIGVALFITASEWIINMLLKLLGALYARITE